MSEHTKARKLHYDLLRILAAFSVVMLHTSAQIWYDRPVNDPVWLAANSWNALMRFGVPIFVMISGALFLETDRELPLGKLMKHHVLRMAVVYVLWSLFYGILDFSRFDLRSLEASQSPIKVFLNEWVGGRYHLWFLPMLIGIYLLLPMLRTWVGHAEKKEIEYFLLLFLILQIGRESARVIAFGRPLSIALINLCEVETVCSYLGYFVLGYYLDHFGVGAKWKKFIYAAGILGEGCNVLFGNYVALHGGVARGDVYDSFTLPTFCVVIALFVAGGALAGKLHFSERTTKVLVNISADTFGIYLMHVGALEILCRLHPDLFTVAPAVMIPVNALRTFLVCMLLAAVLRRIPVIGKYIC